MDVIYADELVALNALIDYVLLRLSAGAAELPVRRGFLALGALLGGLYALAAALWGGLLRTPAGALPVSALMCAVSFGSGRAFFKGWGAFLGLSALFAGAVFAAALLSGQAIGPGGFPAHISWRLLLVCFSLCWAGVRLYRSRFPAGEKIFSVAVRLAGRCLTLSALRDTGNRLTDPITGCPVLVADAAGLRPLLGTALPLPLPEDSAVLLRLLARDETLAARLGMVPYRAVSGRGMLVTIRPDSVTVDGVPHRALIALSPVPLGGNGYNAIL